MPDIQDLTLDEIEARLDQLDQKFDSAANRALRSRLLVQLMLLIEEQGRDGGGE